MRWPSAKLLDIASKIILTASSASLATSWGKCAASLEINSDFVMTNLFFLAGQPRRKGHGRPAQHMGQPADCAEIPAVSSSPQTIAPARYSTPYWAEFLVSSLALSRAPR